MAKKKKQKKQKPKKQVKTKEERRNETDKMKEKLLSIGFPLENEGIVEILEEMEYFVENGLSYCSENIKLIGFKRVACLILTMRKNTSSSLCLKFNKEV